MLFICTICEYGHTADKVECFYSVKEKRQKYLCEVHLHRRDGDLLHMPWDAQLLQESNVRPTCSLCKPTGVIVHGICGSATPFAATAKYTATLLGNTEINKIALPT